ncbi:MAG TPA: TPM domain-containing protein [Bacteroidales bacterium]|nr:TPM domain-containing protein [Bacteroidales bacterium]
MKAADFFTTEQKKQITDAIKEAELNTSGEIRMHIEMDCKEDVLDRAAFMFEKLKIHKTELRNGVLFYLSINDRKFAILGDAGINAVTPNDFWDEIKETVIGYFKKEEYTQGLSEGIKMAGQALQEHFPYQKDDINELSDDISFGKKN